MKDSVLRELASMAFSSGDEGEAARGYALEQLPKRYLKKYKLYLNKEIRTRRMTVKAAGVTDEKTKEIIQGIFPGSDVRYEVDSRIGAGLELEHGDNVAKINIQNIIERAINGIKENL
jgi:hypothetical protein